MNLAEVASLLQLSRERARLAIDDGITTSAGVLVRLPAVMLETGPDVTESDLDAFIRTFEEHEPGRHPPVAVRRALLIEAGYKCAICRGDAPLEFHHIVEWAKIKHHDPQQMFAVCANCHAKISRYGQPDLVAQKEIKRRLHRDDSSRPRASTPPSPPSTSTGAPADPMRIALSVLGGDVMRAISYSEPGSGARRIAAVRRASAKDFDVRVHLLEAVGPTYRCVWSSDDDLFSFTDNRILEAADIDRDGVCELLFTDHMYGTHQSSKFLFIYFPRQQRVFSVSEHSDPSWYPAAPTPNLVLEPEPPPELRDAIIDAATSRGFLRLVEEDPDQPEGAMRRWFRDNGHIPAGVITVHEYEGPPAWGTEAESMIVVGDVAWCAHFKGPLVRYDRRGDRHYIAYAPADRYSCATALAWDGESVWFGIHTEPGLGRFHEPSKTLQRVERVGSLVLPQVHELTYDAATRRLVLNGEIKVRLDDLLAR